MMQTAVQTAVPPMPENYQNILMAGLPPEQDWALVCKYRDTPRIFMKQFLKIKNKRGDVLPLDISGWPGQRYLDAVIQEQRRAGKPVRIIALKARQEGVSTYTEGFLYTRTRLWPNSNCLIVAHEQATAEKIFGMTQFFHTALPEELRPMTRYNNKGQLRYENPKESLRGDNPGLMSEVVVRSAKTVDIARGYTLHGVHYSELASYKKPAELMLSVMQAIPREPDTFAIIESTAKGAGGAFYNLWRRAVTGDTDWIPVFLPFFIQPEYEDILDAAMQRRIWDSLDDDERDLLKRYPAMNLGRISWRRRTIQNECGGSIIKFKQEYPTNDVEAFTAQGETVIDLRAIMFYEKRQACSGRRGRLIRDARGKPHFVEDPKGFLTVWRPPKPAGTEIYCIGCDSALGSRELEQRKEREEDDLADPDYSACEVVSSRRIQCAEYQNQFIDPYEFAEFIALLGAWYNQAYIHPEAGNQGGGYAVQYYLKMINYPRIISWEKWDDTKKNAQLKAIGWEPTVKALPILLSTLMMEVRRGAGLVLPEQLHPSMRRMPKPIIYSRELLTEMTTYSMLADGMAGARHGSHDDLVRAYGLALLGLNQLPPPREAIHCPFKGELWYGARESLGGSGEYPGYMYF
jgi:hypothetical protein